MSTFKDKTVLITGGADGIGFILAEKSIREGATTIILWDINEENLNEAVAKLSDKATTSGSIVDVSDPSSVKEAAHQALEQHGHVDILINNAGVIFGKSFVEHTDEDIQRTVGVNQLALMYVTKAFLPSMMERNEGHIVAITSSAGLTPNPGMVAYVSSKWGAVGWIESLKIEIGRTHPAIRFLNVMPGYIGTKMFKGVTPPRMMPLLDPDDITERIIYAIKKNKTRLKAPALVKITTLSRGLLPEKVYNLVAENIFKVYSSMDTFEGKKE